MRRESTEAIENLMLDLKLRHSLVLVTHNLGQAGRICDRLALLGIAHDAGQSLCTGETAKVLRSVTDPALRV